MNLPQPALKPVQHFKLASTFEKEATFAEIASASGLAEDQVKRILRYSMASQIFQEPRKGVVAHNYNWGDHANGTVVDIGGSHGTVCIGVAEKFSSLKFIV